MTSLPGLDVYPLLTVDLLHEVELGVWKALFTHIVRILHCYSSEAVAEFDRRYGQWHHVHRPVILVLSLVRFRMVPPFGQDNIRRFSNNASQMKGLAAHNFEDLLQV